MTQYVLETVVDGRSSTMMLDAMPTALTLKLHRIENPVDTVIATKQVLP